MSGLLTLGIETSGNIAAVAVCSENEVLGNVSIKTRLTHSQVILPLVKKLLSDAEIDIKDIDCVAVANGPGSYTGLRIGIAAVKGICMATGAECCGVSTLKELAYNLRSTDATVFSVMKARKGVVYFGAYKAQDGKISCIYSDRVCRAEEISELYGKVEGNIILVGDCCEEIKNELFNDCDRVRLAPPELRLQNAVSVCYASINEPDSHMDADILNASYLQGTKAEKDKAHTN